MTSVAALTCYRTDGWIGIIGNGRWLLTEAGDDDPIVERSWGLIRDGAELHQLVAMFTTRTDIAYALVGTAGDITQVVVRGPVRAELATSGEAVSFAGAMNGEWSGHVVTEPVLSVTLAASGQTSAGPVRRAQPYAVPETAASSFTPPLDGPLYVPSPPEGSPQVASPQVAASSVATPEAEPSRQASPDAGTSRIAASQDAASQDAAPQGAAASDGAVPDAAASVEPLLAEADPTSPAGVSESVSDGASPATTSAPETWPEREPEDAVAENAAPQDVASQVVALNSAHGGALPETPPATWSPQEPQDSTVEAASGPAAPDAPAWASVPTSILPMLPVPKPTGERLPESSPDAALAYLPADPIAAEISPADAVDGSWSEAVTDGTSAEYSQADAAVEGAWAASGEAWAELTPVEAASVGTTAQPPHTDTAVDGLWADSASVDAASEGTWVESDPANTGSDGPRLDNASANVEPARTWAETALDGIPASAGAGVEPTPMSVPPADAIDAVPGTLDPARQSSAAGPWADMPRPEHLTTRPAATSSGATSEDDVRRPIWDLPPTPAQAPVADRPRTGGLISDVSWADVLAAEDPANATPRSAAPSRPAIEDTSWTKPQPEAAQPQTAQPQIAQPANAQLQAAQPGSAQPATAQPANAQPQIAQPGTAQLQAAQPGIVQPATAQPQPAQPQSARDPFAGTTTPLQDLDITIWRPIAATSVMTGGSLTVAAVRCVDGHLNPLTATSCRVCAKAVPLQASQVVTRPPLGILRMSTSDTIRLDHGVIFGRDPGTPDANRRDQPYFVKLADKDISRRHLEVALDGWEVVAVDLDSSNGSAVTMPGGLPEVIAPGERRLLVPGTIVHLSDTVSFVFEVTP